jgi:hypothetical protein
VREEKEYFKTEQVKRLKEWKDLLRNFEAAEDEWTAMEAVVHLELLLEAEDLLIEDSKAYASRSGQDQSRAA